MKDGPKFAWVVLFSGAAFLSADTPRTTKPTLENIRSILSRVKLQEGAVPVRLFAQGEKVTVNVVTPVTPIPAHYHARHEEVVYIVKGSGTMELGGTQRKVKEGDIIFIPRKSVHSFTPKGTGCQVLSIFAPAFDGKDRVFVATPVPGKTP